MGSDRDPPLTVTLGAPLGARGLHEGILLQIVEPTHHPYPILAPLRTHNPESIGLVENATEAALCFVLLLPPLDALRSCTFHLQG